MNKIMLDCGQFDGVAIQQYCVDDSWEIYSFEPDPKYPENLPPHNLIKKAVWTEDGEVEFLIDPHQQSSHISGIIGGDWTERRIVQTIDFSKFVASLPTTLIVCSMDIEGAEFPVLRKMLEEGTISKINVLDIEFHQRFMLDEDDESARKLIQEISDRGVVVRLKIVLGK